MRFQDFSLDQLDELPKVERNALRLLWHSEYWDGPMSGLLSYQGATYWFQAFEGPHDATVFRQFLILELSPEQLHEKEYWHDLFRQKVGMHTDYDESGNRPVGMVHPREKWHEYYDAYQNHIPLDLSDNRLIGWFDH